MVRQAKAVADLEEQGGRTHEDEQRLVRELDFIQLHLSFIQFKSDEQRRVRELARERSRLAQAECLATRVAHDMPCGNAQIGYSEAPKRVRSSSEVPSYINHPPYPKIHGGRPRGPCSRPSCGRGVPDEARSALLAPSNWHRIPKNTGYAHARPSAGPHLQQPCGPF